jgi:hypothetical protein
LPLPSTLPGIIFSGLTGLTYLISSKEKAIIEKIPFPVIISWIISIPIYLFFLSKQSSHLGNWPKPNELSDFLAVFNFSLLLLTILIPLFLIIITNKTDGGTKARSIEEIHTSRPMAITSLFWLSVPFLFWTLSHLSSLNLFVDRYFIPKESALIFLVAYGLSFILQKLYQRNLKNIPLLGTFGLSLILILVSTKRIAFGLNKDTNYHHSLIIEETYPPSEQPIIFEGDPKYFPNAYLGKNECLFSIKNESLVELYQNFSSKIKFLHQ